MNSSFSTRLFLEGREIDLSEDISIANTYGLANVKDISKKNSSFSKTIKIPGSTNNNALLNFLFDIQTTGNFFIAPDNYTAKISNSISGLSVTSATLDGSSFSLPITNGHSSISFHNQVNFINWFVTVTGNTDLSGYVVCKVNGNIISCNKITAAVSTYCFPADKYTYDDVLEMDFQTTFQPFDGNIGRAFDFKKKAKAEVIQDGQIIISGYAKLVNAVSTNGNISYSLQITSEIGGFISDIANQRLEDLFTNIDLNGNLIDLDTPFDFQYTLTNITQSWLGVFPYVVPLVDYGNDSTVNFTNFYTSNLRPCIYAKSYWDAIFESVGYTYESNFLNSEFFESLLCPFKEGQISIIDKYPVDVTSSGGTTVITNANSTSTAVNIFNDVLLDNYGVYNSINTSYTAKQQGLYNITTNFICNLSLTPATYSVDLATEDLEVWAYYAVFNSSNINYFNTTSFYDIPAGTYTFDIPSGTFTTNNFQVSFPNFPIVLNKGDYVKVALNITGANQFTRVLGGSPVAATSIKLNVLDAGGFQPDLQITLASSLDGQFLRYKDFCWKDVKQKDFIESIIKCFNLYPIQDLNQPKRLLIYTRDEFFANQNTLDWSSKLDNDSEITIQPIPNLDAKKLLFSFKEDKDFWNKLYSSYFPTISGYGSVKIETGYEFGAETKDVMKGIIFSPTPAIQASNNILQCEGPIEIMNTPFTAPTTNSSSNIIAASGYYAANGNVTPEPTNTTPVSNNFSGTPFTNARVGVHIVYWGVEYIISKVFNPYAFQVTDTNGNATTLVRPIVTPLTDHQVNSTYYATNDGFYYTTNSDIIISSIVESPDNGVTFKPTKSNPRLLYFKNAPSLCNPYYIQYTPYLVNGIYNYYDGTASGSTNSGVQQWNEYYSVIHLDDPISPTKDLNFGEPVELFFSFAGTYPSKNLFSRYWINTVNEISDNESKHVTCSLKLNSIDISNLDLSDIISINNTNYRINQITDYMPDDSKLTKTELIRLPFFQFVTEPPIVSAGPDQSINQPTSSINFAGVATGSDNDGIIIEKVLWTQVSGPSCTITDPTNLQSTVTGMSSIGTYIFNLFAVDNYGLSANDQMSVTVSAHVPCTPSVSAGNDGPITLPTSSVDLMGTASGCNGSTIVTYAWTQVSGPNTAIITNASNQNTTATGLIAGTYVFKLTVTDDFSETNNDTTSVVVNPAINITIQNSFSTANITAVSGPGTLTPAFTTITGIGNYSGAFGTGFTAAISITRTGTVPGGSTFHARLFKNGSPIGSPIQADSTSTYTFPSTSYLVTDVISFTLST
jgi:hypothetical protein